MLNRRFIPCHLLLNWNISAFSTCWNGLDQHELDKLCREWKNSDWRSWKKKWIWNRNRNKLWSKVFTLLWRGLSGVLKLFRSEFCMWERNSSRIWLLVNKVHENSEYFFLATNDYFSSSLQDQIIFTKSMYFMNCPDLISWSKYYSS